MYVLCISSSQLGLSLNAIAISINREEEKVNYFFIRVVSPFPPIKGIIIRLFIAQLGDIGIATVSISDGTKEGKRYRYKKATNSIENRLLLPPSKSA